MAKRDRIIAIVPAYNEQNRIGNVVQRIRAQGGLVDAIVVVDDCSSDGTSDVARKAGAIVLNHQPNKGVGAAIRTGMDYGLSHGYQVGVVLSGDDQHNPEELPRMLEPILSGECDFIQGSRYLAGGRTINQNLFRRITTLFYRAIFFMATGIRCSDVTNGFRAFRLEKLLRDRDIDFHQEWLNRYELEVYMLYKVYHSPEYRRLEVPITIRYHTDQRRTTKMIPIVDWWRILRPLLFLKLGVRR